MSKYQRLRALTMCLPASWTDALQEVLSPYVANFKINQISDVAVTVPADASNGQVAISIEGFWRYNTADATATHPGGAVGVYDLYVTTGENVFSETPDPDTDLTDYSFQLVIKPTATPPSVPHYRKVALVYWDGTRIYLVEPLIAVSGLPKHAPTHEPGGNDPMTVDAAGATGSLRTLGSGALQAAAGADSRFPSPDEKDALAGTFGSPGTANKYVTDQDSRLSNTRPPGIHAATHRPGASDAIDYSWVHLSGNGAPPTPASAYTALFYLRLDDTDGPTLYRSNGTTWIKAAPGASLLGSSGVPQYVTVAQFAALTPTNGMEVYLVVDATKGIVWHLRYNASSSSPYKWESVGEGTALYSRAHAVGLWQPHTWPKLIGSVDSGWVYTIAGFTGPSIAVPRAGDYYVKWGGHGWIDYYYYPYYWGPHADSPTGIGWMALDGCGIIADPDGYVLMFPHLHPGSVYKVRPVTLTAGTLKIAYRSYAFGIGWFLHLYAQDRTLEIVPIRLA